MPGPILSLVLPIYNEEAIIPELDRRLRAFLSDVGSGVVRGWTTIMILVGLGSSAQLLMTGILGEYVGRIYEEVKRRPLYVVEREINLPALEAARAGRDAGGSRTAE